MKKIFVVIICVLFFTPAVSGRRHEPLANENKAGLYARSIEQVLRLREDEVDLGEDTCQRWMIWLWRFAKGSGAED